MCGDGAGGLYVLNEDTYSDPDGFDKDLELANTVLRLGVDANGNTTTRTVLSRITDESIRLACDRFAPDQGGRVFIANAVDLGDSDCRDKREELLALRKNGNGSQSLVPRLDAIEGVGDCDFEDEVTHLEVSGDGSADLRLVRVRRHLAGAPIAAPVRGLVVCRRALPAPPRRQRALRDGA